MYFVSAEEIAEAKIVKFPALGWNLVNRGGEVFAMVRACTMQEAKEKYKMEFTGELAPEQVGILYRWVNKDTHNLCISWLNSYDSRLEMQPVKDMPFESALQAIREGYVVARGGNRLQSYWSNLDGNLIIKMNVEGALQGKAMYQPAEFTSDDVVARDWTIIDTVLNEETYPTAGLSRRDPTTGQKLEVDQKCLDTIWGVPFKLLKIKKDKENICKAAETPLPQKEA